MYYTVLNSFGKLMLEITRTLGGGGGRGTLQYKYSPPFHYDLMNKLNEITELNIQRKIGEIQQLIRIWSSRNLTPYGKVTIIKSLLISKITHMLLSLPSPSLFCFKDLNNLFANFLWCGKPPKWRKEILEGLPLLDKSLKLG